MNKEPRFKNEPKSEEHRESREMYLRRLHEKRQRQKANEEARENRTPVEQLRLVERRRGSSTREVKRLRALMQR
jgi:hypothetical protein